MDTSLYFSTRVVWIVCILATTKVVVVDRYSARAPSSRGRLQRRARAASSSERPPSPGRTIPRPSSTRRTPRASAGSTYRTTAALGRPSASSGGGWPPRAAPPPEATGASAAAPPRVDRVELDLITKGGIGNDKYGNSDRPIITRASLRAEMEGVAHRPQHRPRRPRHKCSTETTATTQKSEVQTLSPGIY